MMFFIDEPNTYLSVNNKGKAMNEWISTFTHVLLPDELSRDAFIEGIHVKATMLDKEFPRTIPFYVSVSNGNDKTRIEVYPKQNPNKLAFLLYIYPVRGEFQFSENVPALKALEEITSRK